MSKHRITILSLGLATLLACAGCGKSDEATVTDDQGNQVKIETESGEQQP